MLVRVTCAACLEHMGVYEKEDPSENDIELFREYIVCLSCGSKEKTLEVSEPPPPPEPPEEPPAPRPWWKLW